MGRALRSDDREKCIGDCRDCERLCFETALTQCLSMGGPHLEPSHFRLMMNCASLCHTAAEFILARSEFHERVCDLCAAVCQACAASCRTIGNMDPCARACEICAESCAAMTVASPREPLLTHPINRQ
jgi:hypothetical protein